MTVEQPTVEQDLPTVEQALRQANTTYAMHWRSPGSPWRKVCRECTDHDCPALERAEAALMEARTRLLAAGAAPREPVQ